MTQQVSAARDKAEAANRDKDQLLGQFNVVLQNIEYGVLLLDSELHAQLANKKFRSLWPLDEEIMARKPHIRELLDHLHDHGLYNSEEEAWDKSARLCIAAIRNGYVAPTETWRSDGLALQYQCIPLPDGGRVLTYFDITRLKQQEATLREREQRFRDYAEAASDWLWDELVLTGGEPRQGPTSRPVQCRAPEHRVRRSFARFRITRATRQQKIPQPLAP